MAKSQLRSNREAKKPKQPKKICGARDSVEHGSIAGRARGWHQEEDVNRVGHRPAMQCRRVKRDVPYRESNHPY